MSPYQFKRDEPPKNNQRILIYHPKQNQWMTGQYWTMKSVGKDWGNVVWLELRDIDIFSRILPVVGNKSKAWKKSLPRLKHWLPLPRNPK